LQRAADALGQARVRGLVTTGPGRRPGRDLCPAQCHGHALVAPADVLPHCSAVTTHSGHGTVLKALMAGRRRWRGRVHLPPPPPGPEPLVIGVRGASTSASAPWRQPDSIFAESLSAMSMSGASVPGDPATALSQSPPRTSAETRSG
jgi:hypothetical protein